MPRPRMTQEELDARLEEYCQRYGVKLGQNGLPPFPTGKRETQQHKEWMAVYKTHNRFQRRHRGQCERCSAPASPGSIFCEQHRAENSGRTGNHGATLEQRQDLLGAQGGLCPICDNKIDVWDSIDHDHATGEVRAILHGNCNRLVGFAEAVGPKGVRRLGQYLWPRATPPPNAR